MKWLLLGKFLKIGRMSISLERLTVKTRLTSQSDHKAHFSISVSYILCLKDAKKVPKLRKIGQNSSKRQKFAILGEIPTNYDMML